MQLAIRLINLHQHGDDGGSVQQEVHLMYIDAFEVLLKYGTIPYQTAYVNMYAI